MPFKLIEHAILAEKVKKSVNNLLEYHGLKPHPDSIKNIPDKERRIHAQLAMKFVELTTASLLSEHAKTMVLNAAILYIREQIKNTYKYLKPENSTFYNSLTADLCLAADSKPVKNVLPVRNELVDLYSTLEKFMRSKVYIESDPRKGYVEMQPFSSEIISDYSVVADLKNLITRLHELKIETIDAAEELHQKQLAEIEKAKKGKSTGLLGGIFGSAAASITAVTTTSTVKSPS